MEEAPPVTLLGTSYPALADGQYDAIFLGTGLKECILAGLLSVKGWKVLVIDKNDYYGGDCSSLTLESLFEKHKGAALTEGDISRLGRSRDYNIDLIPKFIMSCGILVKMLYTTKVTRYLEFKVVEGSYVFKGDRGEIHKVPSTAGEALSTPLLGFFQKRKLRNFLQFLGETKLPGEEGIPEGSPVETDKTTMEDIYNKFDLEKLSRVFIGHAMALQLNDDYLNGPATPYLQAIKLYGYSVDKYGKSPYLYPVYGLGGLPEGFSRLCAVHGGVFMLNTTADKILYDAEGKAVGIVSGECAATAKIIVGDPSYFPDLRTKVTGKVIRSICIMDHPLKSTDSKSAQVIIPANQVEVAGFPARKNDLYISMVSFEHCVAPKGFYIAIISTMVETATPSKEVDCGISVLGKILERVDIVSEFKVPAKDPLEDNCFVTSSYDATSHFETTARDVMDLYEKITGEKVDLTTQVGEDEE